MAGVWFGTAPLFYRLSILPARGSYRRVPTEHLPLLNDVVTEDNSYTIRETVGNAGRPYVTVAVALVSERLSRGCAGSVNSSGIEMADFYGFSARMISADRESCCNV